MRTFFKILVFAILVNSVFAGTTTIKNLDNSPTQKSGEYDDNPYLIMENLTNKMVRYHFYGIRSSNWSTDSWYEYAYVYNPEIHKGIWTNDCGDRWGQSACDLGSFRSIWIGNPETPSKSQIRFLAGDTDGNPYFDGYSFYIPTITNQMLDLGNQKLTVVSIANSQTHGKRRWKKMVFTKMPDMSDPDTWVLYTDPTDSCLVGSETPSPVWGSGSSRQCTPEERTHTRLVMNDAEAMDGSKPWDKDEL